MQPAWAGGGGPGPPRHSPSSARLWEACGPGMPGPYRAAFPIRPVLPRRAQHITFPSTLIYAPGMPGAAFAF